MNPLLTTHNVVAVFWGLVALALLPLWSRRGIYFGLTVEAGFSKSLAGRRVYRGYLVILGVVGILSLAAAWLNPVAGANFDAGYCWENDMGELGIYP